MDSSTVLTDTIHQAFSSHPKRSYPKGQVLLLAGEDPECIYYIAEGKVRMYSLSYRNDEVAVSIFSNPAFFPMNWAINKTPNKYSCRAETDVTVHAVPTEVALALVKQHPDIMLDLLSRVYRGMDGLIGRMLHLMSGTARSRVIYELIIECRRFGQTSDGGTFALEINESDLAARSGLSRETVSREVQKLKTSGWVSLESKVLIIKSLPDLERSLGETL